MNIRPDRINKVLVINLGGIGDCLLSMPSLKALRRLYPNAHLAVLTLSRSRDVLNRADFLNEIIPIDLRGKGWSRLCRLLIDLRRKRFDMIINMRTMVSFRSAVKMAFIFWFIGSKYRVGRDTGKKGFFLNVKVPENYPGIKHEMEYNLDIIRILGGKTDDAKLEFHIKKEDMEFADNFLRSRGVQPGDALIGISPGAPHPSRRWPLENFIEVGNILSKAGCKILVMGARDEGYIKDELQRTGSPDFLSTIGEIDLGQFAAFIKRCDIQIANDTGAMHIAAAVGTHVVAILGPGSIENYDPRKMSCKATVFYKKVDCAPCEKAHCDSLICLRGISPKEVAGKCLEILGMNREKAGS